MKFFISAVFLLLTAAFIPIHAIPIVVDATGAGAITYPILNATGEYTFSFLELTSTPSSGGPSCVSCNSSNCPNFCYPCSDCTAAPNSQNCQCVLPPNAQQWINNMMVGANPAQNFSITYRVTDSDGVYKGTITVQIFLDLYVEVVLTNGEDNEVYFSIIYSTTTNNSTYSGPCWSIILGPI